MGFALNANRIDDEFINYETHSRGTMMDKIVSVLAFNEFSPDKSSAGDDARDIHLLNN